MKEIKKLIIVAGLLSVFSVACETPSEKVVSEKAKAEVQINKAQENVEAVRNDASKKIEDARGALVVEEAKIKATQDIADAKSKVADEKVQATEKIAESEAKAKKESNPELP
ncbi:MAG: hypothetical protein KBC84_05630 [Proteobacteria bacterium]|nr:hypothetical protein [Pseudomonadota bacterium]